MLRSESPDFLPASGFHSIDKSIRCADKDQLIHDTGSADGGLPQAEPPEDPAITGIEGIERAIHGRKIQSLIRADRGRRDGPFGMETPLQVAAKIDRVVIAAFTAGDPNDA